MIHAHTLRTLCTLHSTIIQNENECHSPLTASLFTLVTGSDGRVDVDGRKRDRGCGWGWNDHRAMHPSPPCTLE
eukprot:scaffold242705_cov39-Tisochrysis_lutea.AAC.2